MLTLSQLLEVMKEGQIVKAEFLDDIWHVIMLGEAIWY